MFCVAIKRQNTQASSREKCWIFADDLLQMVKTNCVDGRAHARLRPVGHRWVDNVKQNRPLALFQQGLKAIYSVVKRVFCVKLATVVQQRRGTGAAGAVFHLTDKNHMVTFHIPTAVEALKAGHAAADQGGTAAALSELDIRKTVCGA